MQVEILRGRRSSDTGEVLLEAVERAVKKAGDQVDRTTAYRGDSQVLVLYGIGAEVNTNARDAHLARGGRVLHFDLGYFGRKKLTGYLRMCLDHDHPWRLLDATPADPGRWSEHGIALREDANEKGPIVLVGLGRKSRAYLNLQNWERQKLAELQKRFPGRQIIFRPKGRETMRLSVKNDAVSPIEDLLKGASLAVCRHSNVAVDAVIAGVPFEAEEGAAKWLLDKAFTKENRLDFLRRLAHWQYRPDEADKAWAFAKRMME